LQELVVSLKSRRVPQFGAVVTFDDGAADNLHNAKPLLKRYHIPATVFVATEYSKGLREFWWDELERLFLVSADLPEKLSLRLNGKTREWDLGSTKPFVPEEHRGWNVLTSTNPTSRHAVYQDVSEVLRELPVAERFDQIAKLQKWAGLESKPRKTHRALTHDEIRQLAEGGLIEVGAHTVNHPALSTLSPPDQITEIVESKRQLESILNRPVTSFAYPYGTKDDYTGESVKAVRQAGFTCACSNYTGVVQPRTDLFELPRFVVRDWDGNEFERRLRGWFRG
jgi:peptidoglycan/xylan/chitin deacetylase (PgdA/CDA1 family)